MSPNDRKYLIIAGILLSLLLVWTIIFYVQESKKKSSVVDESALSRLISRKLNRWTADVSLSPMRGGLPLLNVSRNEMVIGRSRSAALRLTNPKVSGKHLSIKLGEQGEVVVKDLDSTNGTYIEGKKLTSHVPYVLKKGEHLTIGSKDVIYTL